MAPGATTPTVFMNLFRIGHWSADETQYLGLGAKTDLYPILESGVVMYKLLIEGKAKAVFSNEVILKYLTKIYTGLFHVIGKSFGLNSGIGTFQDDIQRFLIAKFFLRYVLKKPQTESVDDIAYYAIKHFSTLSSLQNYEETSGITYDSLSGFLASFGELFAGKEISLQAFDAKWAQTYGEGMMFAVEYAPYLLHFLFAAYHSSVLGGSCKLYNRQKDLRDDGLPKLYNAVIAEIK